MGQQCSSSRWKGFPGSGHALGIPVLILGLAGGCSGLPAPLNALQGLFTRTTLSDARQWVQSDDPDLRRTGILFMAAHDSGGAPVHLVTYRAAVEADTDPLVRAAAIQSLARNGGPGDAAIIAPNLEHASVQVRWQSALALQRLYDPGVLPGLLRAARNGTEQAMVREAVLYALGQYPQDQVVHVLINKGLLDRRLSINRAAAFSLQVLTGQDHGLDARPWLAWYEANQEHAFDDGREYHYQTFHRADTFLESMAFWSTRGEEATP